MKKYELTILNRMMREKKNEEIFHKNHKFQFDGKTYNGFTNGYYILASIDENYGFPEAEKPFDIKKMLKDYENISNDTIYYQDISYYKEKIKYALIDINSEKAEMIKRFNRENKLSKQYRKVYIKEMSDGYNRIALNPIYLLDILKFVGVNNCYIDCKGFDKKTKQYMKPLFFKNDDNSKIGLLLPVHMRNDRSPVKEMIDSDYLPIDECLYEYCI